MELVMIDVQRAAAQVIIDGLGVPGVKLLVQSGLRHCHIYSEINDHQIALYMSVYMCSVFIYCGPSPVGRNEPIEILLADPNYLAKVREAVGVFDTPMVLDKTWLCK